MKVGEEGVGGVAVTHLDRRAVLDDPRDVRRDPRGGIGDDRRPVLQERLVEGDEIVHLLDADEAVTVDPGHEPVDLGDDQRRHLQGRLDDVNRHPQAHVPVVVGGGGLDEGDVDGGDLSSEEIGDLGEEYGGVVGRPPVDGVPGAVANEEGVEPEVIGELLVGVGGDPEGPDVDHLRLEEGLGVTFYVIDEGLEEVLGLAAAGADEYPVAGVDVSEYRAEGGELLGPDLPLPLVSPAAIVLVHLNIPLSHYPLSHRPPRHRTRPPPSD
ncbi:MAG: hypothetical protein A4E50_02061 [Methanosaeta sp. PtaB.Bin087]|nr:MAG: hypothetical protein A4E50_02061 [Methanosaeta sp. PtaB.Bin087]